MTPPPTSIDGTDITGATIDGQDVEEITIDGQTVFTADPVPNSIRNNMTSLYGITSDSVPGVADLINGEPATTDGTLVSGSEFFEGFGLDFDRANDERLRSDNQVNLNGSAQSVAAWVTFDDVSDQNIILYMGDQTSGSESRDDGWYVRTSGPSDVDILDGDLGGRGAGIPLSVNPSPNLSNGNQFLIAATCIRSGGTDTFELYVYDNNSRIAFGSTTSSNRVTTGSTFVYGMREPNKDTVDGRLDLMMFNESTAVSGSVFDQIHADTKAGR